MQKYQSRAEVPEKYKWDLTEFFKDEEEFNKSLEETNKLIDELKNYVGCTKDANKIYEFLTKEIEAIALWEDLYVYAYLIADQELGVQTSIERKNKTFKLNLDLEQNTSFFAPELLKLEKNQYEALFKQCENLSEYRHALDLIYREKEHILTENEERIVSELTNAVNHYDDMSSNLLNNEHNYGKVKLEDGEVVTIAPNNYRSLMRNKNTDIRRKVYRQFNKKIDEYSATNASYLNSYIGMNCAIARIRHFKDSWDEKLFSWNLSDKVFKTLVKVTEDNVNILQKYYDLKRKVLGLEELTIPDLSLDLNDNPKEYSIDEAQQLVLEAIKPLGNDYTEKFKKIIDGRFIDYCQYKGKCSGGYSFATINHNSRILMSYNGELDSVSTIAHEGGHNVHHQYVNLNNPKQYREVSSIVAEVCSLTNECLLSDYLYRNGKTKEEKLAGIYNIMTVIVSNLFGAVREGKLEQDMYKEVFKGGVLTKEFLDKKTKSSLKKYYGNSVKMDCYAKNGWVTRSHYYMHFYLYSYAICISVASSVASKILDGDKEMLSRYLEFMKVGADKWPMEVFSVLGIDLEDEKVYKEAISYFDSLVTRYNTLYDEEVSDGK